MPAPQATIRLAAAIAAVAAVAGLAAVPGASAASPSSRPLTPPLRAVLSIDAYRSQAVITRSTSKGTTKLRLVTASGSRDLPTEPGMVPGASIGTDANGRPVLVFQRCATPWKPVGFDGRGCTVRTTGIDGRGERVLDPGLPTGVKWGVDQPHMSGGRLAFIASSDVTRGIFVKRPGQSAVLAFEDRSTVAEGDDSTPDTLTTAIDYEGDVLLEFRTGGSVGGFEKLLRVRRLGRAPAVVPGTQLEGRYTDIDPDPLLGSAQLEGGNAYWVAKSRIGRAAPATGDRGTSAPRGALGPLIAVGGTRVFAARKLRSGRWTVVAIPLPRFSTKG